MTASVLSKHFNVDEFLSEYWQKKPLFIPQLLPDFQDPISPEELAGLALEPDCESRLLEGVDPDSWTLSQGPFTESKFTSLPEDGWSLLVQAVDQWSEPVFELKQLFEFLPQWRLEDVMVSFAADGSGVGPHFDYYDVFLIQGRGERRWRVGPKYSSKSKSKNCSGLLILDQFETDAEYTLKQGDALYIPPQYGHWGTSRQRSLCYSIGCRAPSMAEILEGYSDFLIDRCTPDNRYIDPVTQRPVRRGEITTESIGQSFNKFLELVDNKGNYYRWFGEQATRPKQQGSITSPETAISKAALLHEIGDGAVVAINPASRLSFLDLDTGQGALLFVDGETIELSQEHSWFARCLCKSPEISTHDFNRILQAPEILEITLSLLNQGSLISY